MFKKNKLSNGLRIITVPMEGTKTVTVLVLVGTGSRFETEKISGISHYLEHLFFKGTKKRPNALMISEELERIGADFNAFTSKEYTGFYVKVPVFHLDVALDVISDMLFNSLFLSKEIERERGTIQEEIKMVKDDPPRYVADLFETLLYGKTPMGREIIGTPETVNSINRKELISYFRNHYVASNATLVIAGAIESNSAVKMARKYFQNFKEGKREKAIEICENQSKSKILIYPKQTNQVHLSIGVRGYDTKHPDKHALTLLSVILGGGMSSRLFISVREKLGLAYYIFSSPEFYTDTGYLTTQAGVDIKNVQKAINVILTEYKKIAVKGVSKEELKKVKDQIKSRTIMRLESSSAMANYFADQELLTENIQTPEEKFALLDKVKIEDIQRVAKDIFMNKKLNLVLVGPFKRKEEREFVKMLKI
ncbi:insulinase family protein [Patescibacteria group bacterium]|nr:insulinase family protein [Patescibacteria group bacterium]